MKRSLSSRLILAPAILLAAVGILVATHAQLSHSQEDEKSSDKIKTDRADESLPTSKSEALGRARWLHEAMHGALQVMHRDFFGDGDDGGGGSLTLPSQSLEDVFKEMARSWQVEIQWLGVNATKDIDHEPDDDFERAAAKALKGGDEEYSQIEGDRFRFVGAITLHNQCLKCHVPNRSSLEDRIAGLSLSFPLNLPPEE